MKPFWSPKTERIQLVVLCLLLSPPPPTRVAAPVSEQTNKEQRAPSTGQARRKRPIGAFAPDPPPPCKEQPPTATQALLSVSVCFTPLLGHTDSRTADYLFINPPPPSPSILSLSWPAKPAPANRLLWQQPAHRADQSESRCRALPASDWSSRVGERSGGSVHARALPCQRPPVYLPSRQTWPSQFG